MARFQVTGKVVAYDADGAHVIDAEIRRFFNATSDYLQSKFKTQDEFIIVAAARTVPTNNIYAADLHAEKIDYGLKYTRTKFFRLLVDLMKLAQFDPFHRSNYFPETHFLRANKRYTVDKDDIDFTKSVAEIDAQLYRKYQFTPAMIAFTEGRYSYDELHGQG